MVKFGGLAPVKESTRDEFRLALLEDSVRDLRHGARALRRAPGLATVAVLTLALGIGANTVVFSVVNGVLLRPLAAERTDELARVVWDRQDDTQVSGDLSWPNYVDLRDQTTAFSGLAGHSFTWVAFDAGGLRGANETPDVIFGELVTANYFDVLGVKPALGRVFSPSAPWARL